MKQKLCKCFNISIEMKKILQYLLLYHGEADDLLELFFLFSGEQKDLKLFFTEFFPSYKTTVSNVLKRPFLVPQMNQSNGRIFSTKIRMFRFHRKNKDQFVTSVPAVYRTFQFSILSWSVSTFTYKTSFFGGKPNVTSTHLMY